MADELQEKLEKLGLKSSKLSADLNFARQKEFSMKNALYEKNQQLAAMRTEGRQLVEQLGDVEESFSKQLQDYEACLKSKAIECANWEASSLELQKKQNETKEALDNSIRHSAQLEEQFKRLTEQRNADQIQNSKQKQQALELLVLVFLPPVL